MFFFSTHDQMFIKVFVHYFFAIFILIKNCFKGATKLYFTHYSCVVIILFHMSLYKSAFSTDSFGKLVFCIFALFALCGIRCDLHKLYNICTIIAYIAGDRYSVSLFSKEIRVTNIWIRTHLKKVSNNKHASQELLRY